ncbi:MAG TPA: aspartate 1-decarboxylase [Lacunisphaera sp.]|jgi:aspartate 1-decarboxylase
MQRTFLKTKLHRATITSADLNYEGSISLGRDLCRAAGLIEFEQVDIYDVTNGARFTTYVIYGEPAQVQINGAAARLVQPGDRIIVAGYVQLDASEVANHSARVVLLGDKNAIHSVEDKCINQP